jgi:hypothetical protein
VLRPRGDRSLYRSGIEPARYPGGTCLGAAAPRVNPVLEETESVSAAAHKVPLFGGGIFFPFAMRTWHIVPANRDTRTGEAFTCTFSRSGSMRMRWAIKQEIDHVPKCRLLPEVIGNWCDRRVMRRVP